MESHYKILHTACHTQWGGIEKRIFNECVWMEKNGQKIILAAPPDTPLFLKAKAKGIKVYGIGFKRLSMIRDYTSLHRIFYNERPDIVNAHGSHDSTLALTAAERAGVPCKILSHHFGTDIKNFWLGRRIVENTSDFIFTNSDYTTNYFKGKFKFIDRKIFTVPPGIVLPESLLSKPAAKGLLAKELGLEPHARFLGIMGNLTQNIDVFRCIEAFKKIQPRLPDHHLLIAGSGKKKDLLSVKNLIQKTDRNNRIHLLNDSKNIWSLLRALDCQITPVKDKKNIFMEEILENILKAMYCLCPVMVSPSNEVSNLMGNGKTGLVFEPEDEENSADTLFHILNNESQTRERTKTARDMVKNNHTIDKSGNYILKLLRLFQVKSDGPERDTGS